MVQTNQDSLSECRITFRNGNTENEHGRKYLYQNVHFFHLSLKKERHFAPQIISMCCTLSFWKA